MATPRVRIRVTPFLFTPLYLSALIGVSAQAANISLKPLSATASGIEGQHLNASLAIDGNPNSRWSSLFNDNQWIQFDFGKKVNLSRVTIDWERAYGKKYALLGSDNGQNWQFLKTVDNSDGGRD